jgi:flagellin
MSSDIVLTAALRSNLLSLQNTQSLIDQTQLNLATGRSVNSALDNPQNFFAAESLNNRANDLNRLLDGIGQSITAIQQADTAISSLTSLVEQAGSVAQQARDAIAAGSQEARVNGTRDLSAATDLTTLNGITAGDELIITVTDPTSNTPGALVDFDSSNAVDNTLNITVNANDSIDQVIASINDNQNLVNGVVEARLDDAGQLEIVAVNGGDVNIQFNANAADTPAADAENLAFAQALGFGDSVALISDGAAAASNQVTLTALGSNALESFNLFDASTGTQEVASRSSLISDLENSDGTSLSTGINDAADDIVIGVNGSTTIEIETNARTVQNVIDDINSNASLNGLIEATFDEDAGQISIRAIDSSAESVQFGFDGNANNDALNLGFGTRDAVSVVAGEQSIENIRLGSAAGDLADLENEYNNIREQIDGIVADSGYRGTNLLNGDNLTTFFNEDRSNSLVTEGATFTSAGLGITEANFASTSFVDASITEVRDATNSVRTFGSSIANDLAIIQTRENFTEQTINNLNAGADRLTVADQNEEGANLLSLQTRQQLGVTSLSLASQSQQAVLRLF